VHEAVKKMIRPILFQRARALKMMMRMTGIDSCRGEHCGSRIVDLEE